MADVNKRLAKGTLSSAGNVVVYTVPAGKKTFIKAITICNITSTNINFSINLADIPLVSNHTIVASDTITIPFLDQIVESGETLVIGKTGSPLICYYISGREVDV
jgi:hypothetical protein